MRMQYGFIKRVVGSRIMQHLVFWLISVAVLIFLMRVSVVVKTIDLVYVLVFHLILLPPVYFNLYFLVPKLMAKRRYGLFVLASVCNLALGTGWYYLMFDVLVDWFLPGYYFVAVFNFAEIGIILLTYIIATLLLKLARAWFLLDKLEKENTRQQLEGLKSQVNPHFLFNTLSSIYSLTKKKSELAPGIILQLSDIMRYMIYETNAESVELLREIELINNILEIYQVRFGESLHIEKRIEGDISEIRLAPLLFIPFVENVMKHCSRSVEGDFSIIMDFTVKEHSLRFELRNSYNPIEEKAVGVGGIGLENVRKRLSLLYPGKHRLNIEKGETVFTVGLELNIG